MIFGKTYDQQRSYSRNQDSKRRKPKAVFAFWPIMLENGQYAWLRPVIRTYERHQGIDGPETFSYEYNLPKK